MLLQEHKSSSSVLYETESTEDGVVPLPPTADNRKWEILWHNVFVYAILHVGAVYGAYLFLAKAMWATCLFVWALYICSGFGITAGVHRLWTHKSYKARLPLRVLLTFFNTIANQKSILKWARDHRMHHKYSETDADPYNSTRGFFFSHVGWILVKKHPEVKAKGHTIDISDLSADPILRFQNKYFSILGLLSCFILPTYIPTLWGESVRNAFFVCAVFRFVLVLNNTFLVNSAAHKWGNKPYDKNMNPTEVLPISILVLGEGYHNYHHAFPWDYKTDELGNYAINLTKLFIDCMAKIGWAYDLKTVSADVIEKRVKRTGDGTHEKWGDKKTSEKSDVVKVN